MTSSQQAITMNDKEKEIVEKMVEVANNIGSSENDLAANANLKQQNSAVVAMTNSTPNSVNFSKSQNWNGQVSGKYPTIITHASHATFTHQADASYGSKGAVIYLGTNVQGRDCGWLLAWSAPKVPSFSNPNRVYVTCGPATNFNNVNWSQVRANLEKSTDIVNYLDPVTKTAIHANIQPGTNSASVGASFGAV